MAILEHFMETFFIEYLWFVFDVNCNLCTSNQFFGYPLLLEILHYQTLQLFSCEFSLGIEYSRPNYVFRGQKGYVILQTLIFEMHHSTLSALKLFFENALNPNPNKQFPIALNGIAHCRLAANLPTHLPSRPLLWTWDHLKPTGNCDGWS